MKIIKRELYLQKIRQFIDKPVIKIITGVRRCGKSYMLKQVIGELKLQNVSEEQILYINKELFEFDFIKSYSDLNNHIVRFFKKSGLKRYLFVDEIQEIEKWEKCIVSLFSEGNYDIYITGSNAHLLSDELATLLAGRYIEINIYPLSFAEFLDFREQKKSTEKEFELYLQFGGFPVIHFFDYNAENIYQYIQSLYNTILIKDIVTRYNVRNVQLFENIARYVFDNTGNIFSGGRINKYLKSQKISIGLDTIQNYLRYLESSFLVYRVKRFDLKGKRILDIYEKYYLSDIALKHAVSGYRQKDIPGMLENIVYLKLRQLGYNVFIGKYGDREVDFIAQKPGQVKYLQVAYLLESEKTTEREFAVLKQIRDNYPKYVVTMDKIPVTNNEGIIRMNIIDFLLSFE